MSGKRAAWRLARACVAGGICAVSMAAPADSPPKLSNAAVASAHPLATRAGVDILRRGGNAFDAAVAVSAALAVVEPMGSGLGGGGFFLLHRARDGLDTMVDGRERAPLAARADMYRDADGRVIPRASLDGPLAAAIPGEPAALAYIAARYGKLPLADSLAAAIQHARSGFAVTARLQQLLKQRQKVFNPHARAVYLAGGDPPALGAMIRQPQLAETLEALSDHGRNGFYAGPVAERLISGVVAGGGIWAREDLARYRVVERTPVRGTYLDVQVISAAPPSSGGVVLVEMLNMLENWTLPRMEAPARVHYLVEAMRRAYRDRALYLGDPDFVPIGVQQLVSKSYARKQVASITDMATPSGDLGDDLAGGGADTTHFSVLDSQGNRVAATLSINSAFGSGFMPAATGVLLNNEMDDFSSKPGVANVYGLVGGTANAIAPGKRPLSSMTPTFLETDDSVAALGTPGGSRIITMVLLAALDFAHGERDPAAMVERPRFHHQYLPDQIFFEPGALAPATLAGLRERGHIAEPHKERYGNMQMIVWDKQSGVVRAASDPRGEGAAQVVALETREARRPPVDTARLSGLPHRSPDRTPLQAPTQSLQPIR